MNSVSHMDNLCSSHMEMKGRIAEAYCKGNKSVLIKEVLCKTEQLNSAADYLDAHYSKRRQKHSGCLHTAFPFSSTCSFSRDFSCYLWCWIRIPWKVSAGVSGTKTWPTKLRRVSWAQKTLAFAFLSDKLLPLWIFLERNRHTQVHKKKPHTIHFHSLKLEDKTLSILLHSPHVSSFQSTLCVLSTFLVE